MSSHRDTRFEVRNTEYAGRGVFATQNISSGTLLLLSNDLTAVSFNRDHLREVCAWCFAYNRGRHWALRDGSAGVVWCSAECKVEWLHERGGEIALSAHGFVETVLKKKNLRRGENNEKPTLPKPTIEDIEIEWRAAEKVGTIILAARTTIPPTKAQSRILANLPPPSPETLTHLLAIVLSRSTSSDSAWCNLLALYPSSTPYLTFSHLQEHITAYHHLLAVLPNPLLPFATSTTLRSIVARDVHNSFGIRSLDDEGSEIFGHGIWPSASYWNHSCEPSVDKRRVGRTWEFWAMRDVKAGEELCITYLGGEERELDVRERRERLRNNWAFDCGCGKCVADSGN